MSTTTTNYQFHKPELTDPADITKLNPNWDKIDELLAKFIDIPANADLNNYTEIGRYVCGINARVATLSNCPTTVAFYLEVGKHAGVYQRLVEYNASEPKIYFRNRDDNANWGTWKREYSTVDKPSPADIGAAKTSTVLNVTLSASSWSSGVYSISNSLVTDTSIVELAPASTITAAQLKALQKANIIDGGMTSGTIKLKALGTTPTVDIPVVVIIRGDA